MATSRGLSPTGTVATTMFTGCVDHRHVADCEAKIRDIGKGPVWSNRHPVGFVQAGHRGYHSVSGCVDHRHVVEIKVCDVGKGPVWSDGHPKGGGSNRHGGHHRVRGCVDYRDVVGITRDIGERLCPSWWATERQCQEKSTDRNDPGQSSFFAILHALPPY